MNAGPMLDTCMQHQLLPDPGLEPGRAREFTESWADISRALVEAGRDVREGWAEPGEQYGAYSYPGMLLVSNTLDDYSSDRMRIPILMVKTEYWDPVTPACSPTWIGGRLKA